MLRIEHPVPNFAGWILSSARTKPMNIDYRDNAEITVEAAIDLYNRSTLGQRRPVDRPDIFASMLQHATLTISAWDGNRLVGIARSLTDWSYVTYLADLAVDAEYQRQGIGKRLIEETKARLWPECMIVLLAAPLANEYYSRLGFEHNPRAWVLRGGSPAAPVTT
jgi:predicted N-acetyltransferase YhbS